VYVQFMIVYCAVITTVHNFPEHVNIQLRFRTLLGYQRTFLRQSSLMQSVSKHHWSRYGIQWSFIPC